MAWETLVLEATSPYGPDGFSAFFRAVSDTVFEGMTPYDLARVPGDARLVFAADGFAMVSGEKTVTAVDRDKVPGRSFRVVLPEVWGVENNLRLGNIDFHDFLRAVDNDGVFRGFGR